jgi:ketosteroid isomerase-like protein
MPRADDAVQLVARRLVGETGKVYEHSYVCVFQVRAGKLAGLKGYVIRWLS